MVDSKENYKLQVKWVLQGESVIVVEVKKKLSESEVHLWLQVLPILNWTQVADANQASFDKMNFFFVETLLIHSSSLLTSSSVCKTFVIMSSLIV